MEDEALGKRMERLAVRQGLKAPEIARRMGMKEPSLIYRWYRGERTPTAPNVVRFAAAIGVSADELLGASPERQMAQLFLRAMGKVMNEGRSIPAGLDYAYGEQAPLTNEERRLLAEGSAGFREAIRRRTGREWKHLTEAEQLAQLQWLRELLDEPDLGDAAP